MIVITKKLSELRHLEKNVRKHNEKQISEYMRSLKMFGQIRPMVIDDDGVILVGNGMYEAMLRLGWETGDCYVAEGLTEKQKTKLMLADNRVYELGFTDMDMFDELIKELGDDIDVPGWDEDLLQTITSSMTEATAMVESYGLYAPDEVRAYSEIPRAYQTEPSRPNAPNAVLQRPSDSIGEREQVSDSPEFVAASAPVEALSGRFIICPHCGQQIPVTPDMIGGE